MKTIISFDSQNLNAIQTCARKAELQFIRNLQPTTKAPALEKGDLLHKMMEIYDGLKGNCVNLESDTWLKIQEAQLISGVDDLLESPTEKKILFSIEAGRMFASKMDLPTEVSAEVIYQFSEYCKFYTNDPWSTLAVEEVATRVLYEDEEIKVLYSGKLDRVVEQGNIQAWMDHKSSERRSEPSSMSNQFIGYCWLLGMNHGIIDKIGFQKTLKPHERFQRFIITVDDARIKEWESNSIYWVRHYLNENLKKEFFPMNLTSCDKYGSCIYQSICETSPEGREWKMERDYVVGEQWDVGKVLESSSEK